MGNVLIKLHLPEEEEGEDLKAVIDQTIVAFREEYEGESIVITDTYRLSPLVAASVTQLGLDQLLESSMVRTISPDRDNFPVDPLVQ